MNDEQLQPLLEVWLRDREIPRPEVRTGVASVMVNVPRTRQQSRWLPFPVSHRRAQTPTASESAEYRPSPIPATNGHAPTVTGRTRLMFSPVKAIIAGALTFALGGAFLIAQPFGQQDRLAPGAEPIGMEGARATVAQDCPDLEDGTVCTWTSSDPRLTGTMTQELDGAIEFTAGDVSDAGDFFWTDVTVEGPEGSWTGRLYINGSTIPATGLAVLSGSGAYEGWQYVATEVGGNGYHDLWIGMIYEGELPPFGPPAVPASE